MEKIVLFLQDDCLEISQSADAWFRTKAYVNGRAAGVIGSGSMRIPVKPGETIRIDVYDGDGETFYGSTVFSCEGDRLIRQLGGSAGVDFRIAEAPYDLQQAVLEVSRSYSVYWKRRRGNRYQDTSKLFCWYPGTLDNGSHY